MLSGMYKMFYPAPAATTRFEKSPELQDIVSILAQLRAKEAELAAAQEAKGAASVDYGKYTIIAAMLQQIDIEIKKFNDTLDEQTPEQDLVDTRALGAAMLAIVDSILKEYSETLNKFRDRAHETWATAVHAGTFVATIASIYYAPFSILPKLGLYWGSTKVIPTVNETIKENAGLNEEQTRTMIILTGLSSSLTQLNENLGLKIQTLRGRVNSNNL